MTERQDEGAGLGAEGGPSSPQARQPANVERDERVKEAVEAARREAEERATAEILALEADFERERERTAKSLEELQRRLEEAEARAAGDVSVERIETVGGRVEAEQLDAEMRRLQAESDAQIEAALARVESETRTRVQSDADRRLAEREQELRAEADERVRAAGESALERAEKAEARAKRAEASVKDVEAARLDAEAEARSAAAEWLRGQVQEREQPLSAETVSPAGENDSADREAVEGEPRLGFLRRRVEARRARRAERAAGQETTEAEVPSANPAKRKSRPRRRGGPLDVNKASFEQFRELGMSVTQATRVIAYRERVEGFNSVDDLDKVPGMSRKLTEIRDQLTA
ncbi:MAG TPA: helix-hairpin-helix domain-containing protein [Solirubrobacterales bacterium]